MPIRDNIASEPADRAGGNSAPLFSERPAWLGIGDGWRHLHGSVGGAGVSFEWHDFTTERTFDWGRSFHPGSIEVCLNLEGTGRVGSNGGEQSFAPLTAGFYRRGEDDLFATRPAGERHQFLTVEMSFDFLKHQLSGYTGALHPLVNDVVAGKAVASAAAKTTRLTSHQQQLLASLKAAPVLAIARSVWYQAKALEVAAEFFFTVPGQDELFCERQHRLGSERVDKVIALLRSRLTDPPTLAEVGKIVGCSQFHLSRTFSAATGMTIPQYLRQLRLERAAELLRSGKYNVTETALEVGYSSLSHFSQAFHEAFGCCPGLYPIYTPSQNNLKNKGVPNSATIEHKSTQK